MKVTSALEALRENPEMSLALLGSGMVVAGAGVSSAVVLFIVYGHSTRDVCFEIDNTRSQLCELDKSVKVSLPTLSFTAVLKPECWFFIYGLSLGALIIGFSYIGLSHSYRSILEYLQKNDQQNMTLNNIRDLTYTTGRNHSEDNCCCKCFFQCSRKTVGWPLSWVRACSTF